MLKPVVEFCKRNSVILVTCGLLAGIHLAWFKIQNMDAFVPPEDRKAFPVALGMKYMTKRAKELFFASGESHNPDNHGSK